MKIALAQINPTVGDFIGNGKKIREFAERAALERPDLVVFPELAICGYPPADLLEKESFVARAGEVLTELAALTARPGFPAILCGTVMPATAAVGKHVRNVAALLSGGKISFVQQKMLLPFYDVFDEQRYFEPAAQQSLTQVGGQPVAITVCEDAWNDKGFWPHRFYPVDPVEQLMVQWEQDTAIAPEMPKLILNLSASPYWLAKRSVRREMLSALAKRHGAVVAMCNQVGGNDSLIFDGSSLALGPDGSVIVQAASFAEDLVYFDTGAAGVAAKEEDETAAIWDALVLGTRDYVRKCGFSKVLVGLSGGIDSALVAALGVAALGAENVIGVGMPSEYSSLGSIADARKLAKNLGVGLSCCRFTMSSHSTRAYCSRCLRERRSGWRRENLQSRIRGGLLMALSNKFGALVLTTGNKSEMATGYCTLYGDMVGALAVIADVMKTRVYDLSRYANREREVIPRETLEKPPSAELRPEQRDTDSLPPYDVLDPILEAYVERYCSAEQIAAEQKVDVRLVRQVLQLVERSEYKRQQAAPVLKITRKSFGMGRRFPIAAKVQV